MQAGERPADAAPGPPDDRKPDQADDRAGQPARLEQRERQDLCEQRRGEIEAAAVAVEVDERQRALVGQARGVERQQEVAVFGMGVVVPAEPVVAEGRERDDRRDRQQQRARGGRRCARLAGPGMRIGRSMPAAWRKAKAGARCTPPACRASTRIVSGERRCRAARMTLRLRRVYFIAASYIFATYSQFTRWSRNALR